jgi:H+-transporting ATPase
MSNSPKNTATAPDIDRDAVSLDPSAGLTEAEAARRLVKFGENALVEHRVGVLERLLGFFWGPIPWMIEAAAVLSGAVEHWADLAIILTMLFVNAGVGFWQEFKADNAIAMLRQRLALRARVRRDGAWKTIDAKKLVPGDLVKITLGSVIPADVELLAGKYLSVDQSALTGESLPVDKKAGEEAYSGSIVKLGEMTAVVTATGMNTYFGKTAKLVQQAKTVSHFQRAVLKIGNFLILVTIGLVAVIGVAALFRRDPLIETLQFALILTVASIPVALPAVLSVTMAVGAERLAALKAIVSRLVAIEELAGMDMLCSDKTGTLTKNQLTLGDAQPAEGVTPKDVVLAAALASQQEAPDAIDAAILAVAPADMKNRTYAIRAFHPFDPVIKRTEADVTSDDAAFRVAKGAPQVIFDLCQLNDSDRRVQAALVEADAAKGYRTLAVARTDASGAWRFLGLLPLFDPPRDDSRETIKLVRNMGVGIKMVTGDHEAIAREIADKLTLGKNIVVADAVFAKGTSAQTSAEILSADGFARVFPEHKFEIVKALQTAGRIVGMTGDGVNDAPALKQADVGIAVSGATDAARAAADLVLTAPGLTVITTAIEEARRIFERMTSYAIYRIAETIRVLLFMTASILIFNFYPVTAVMVVLLALLNDIPIMMIAYDNASVAEKPVSWDMARVLTVSGVLGAFGVFASFGLFWILRDFLGLSQSLVQSLVFLKLLVAGHMTIYLTRNKGPIWERPWPSWKLIVPCETTQIVGTLAVVYGWFMAPTGWMLALGVWGYALIFFLLASMVKLVTYRLMAYHPLEQARHLARVELAFAGRPVTATVQSLLVGALALATFGYGAVRLANLIEAPGGYATEAATRGSVVRIVEARGAVEPTEISIVTPKVSGVVQEIRCDVDTQVKKGQSCAKLDPSAYEDLVAGAIADLAVAGAQLAKDEAASARAKTVFQYAEREARRRPRKRYELEATKSAYEAVITQIDLDKATIEQKKIALRVAQRRLSDTDVVAPADGTVLTRHIALGQRVEPQAEAPALFTIASDLTKMRTVANVPEREAGEIKPGDKATFSIEGFPNRSFDAVVADVHLTRTTRNALSYDVALEVDNSKIALTSGMAVTVKIVAARRDDVLRVPDEALAYIPRGVPTPPALPRDQGRVWVLQENKPTPKVVRLGLDDGRYTEVVRGELKVGDRVIVRNK